MTPTAYKLPVPDCDRLLPALLQFAIHHRKDMLAKVAQNPQNSEKKSLGRKAITFLKGTISALPDTAKLAEACAKLLPLIAKALGLPV